MSNQKLKTNSLSVDGEHHSATKGIGNDITRTGRKLTNGKCAPYHTKKFNFCF